MQSLLVYDIIQFMIDPYIGQFEFLKQDNVLLRVDLLFYLISLIRIQLCKKIIISAVVYFAKFN